MGVYKIADCIVKYEPMEAYLKKKMEPYRVDLADDELSHGKETITLGLREDYFQEKLLENPHLTKGSCEYILVGAQFYHQLISRGGFMIHASAVMMDGRAYLFSAPMETGKSTHTKLWQKVFGPERAQILNDDKPAVRVMDGVCYAYGTPFSGKSDEQINTRAKLQGICMLERGDENRIWRIEPQEAIRLLIRQTVLPRRESEIDQLFPMLDEVLDKTPVYRMQCTISEDAARMSYEMMRGDIW